MCRNCEQPRSNLAESSFTELPADISLKNWKEVDRLLGIKGRAQLKEFYAYWGMDLVRFDPEYRLLQTGYRSRPLMSTLIADFYATEFIMALLGKPQLNLPLKDIYNLFGGNETAAYIEIMKTVSIPESSPIGADLIRTLAWMRQVEVVELLDELLQNYMALVIGGELRWHPFIRDTFFDGDEDMLRDAAWQSWLPWVKTQPPTAYHFFEQCFRDFYESEPYGGEGWANAAAVLRQRLMHEFSDNPFSNKKLFLDRAFSCEHNNGCILDKLYNVNLVCDVLEAHHESDLIMLSDFASPLVLTLVEAMEQSRLTSA